MILFFLIAAKMYPTQKFALKVNFNPVSANPTKWSNTLKQFVTNLPTNCLSVFNHFVGLAFKVLKTKEKRPCFASTMLLCILAQFTFCCNTKHNLSKHYKVQYLPKS